VSDSSSAPDGPAPAAGGEAARLAFVYVALFGMMGLQLPYWPVYLAHRGLDPGELGVVLGVATWARLAAPWTGSWADRRGLPHRLAAALSAATLVFTAGFALTGGFVPLLLLSAATGLALAPVLPLVDGIAVSASAAGRIDYGRVRLWGSAAFVLVTSVGGFALQGRSPSLVLSMLLVASAALLAATLLLPAPAARVADAPPPGSMLELFRRPGIRVFLAAIACMQGSHSMLYAFGTRHWQAIGIPESSIGWLWSWGVIVEVGLFAIGQRMVARLHPTGLLLVAGLGGVIRWPLLAWVESFGVLFAVQTLHGATFACMHLGAMNWIRDCIDPPAVQRATGLYVAIGSGVALGLGMPLSGVLFESFAGNAYHAMGVASLVGLLFALRLRASGQRQV
jgi:PPP family 3-phenylpropionic acid transporter